MLTRRDILAGIATAIVTPWNAAKDWVSSSTQGPDDQMIPALSRQGKDLREVLMCAPAPPWKLGRETVFDGPCGVGIKLSVVSAGKPHECRFFDLVRMVPDAVFSKRLRADDAIVRIHRLRKAMFAEMQEYIDRTDFYVEPRYEYKQNIVGEVVLP
jgi:hypothetical protein